MSGGRPRVSAPPRPSASSAEASDGGTSPTILPWRPTGTRSDGGLAEPERGGGQRDRAGSRPTLPATRGAVARDATHEAAAVLGIEAGVGPAEALVANVGVRRAPRRTSRAHAASATMVAAPPADRMRSDRPPSGPRAASTRSGAPSQISGVRPR